MARPISSTLTSEFPAPSVVLELLKPITWFPPMWAFGCGVVSSGVPAHGHWPLILAGMVLCGPLLCATSQAVNDWFDPHVDAINEPGRPIPSGRMPGLWGPLHRHPLDFAVDRQCGRLRRLGVGCVDCELVGGVGLQCSADQAQGGRKLRRAIPAVQVLTSIGAGAALLLALRAALQGSSWPWISLWLVAALVAHLLDLRHRFAEAQWPGA